MTPIAILVVALSMSADAFAAAIARGAADRPTFAGAVRAGLVFGVVEAITPLVGWSLGRLASGFIVAVDHWVAFVLLSLVGGRMAWEAATRKPEDAEPEAPPVRRSPMALVATAVGTSIDAAVVGATLAFINANILVISAAIGTATFTMATIGLLIGRMAGSKLGAVVEIVGGLALIGLGVHILLEHTGVIR